VTVGAIHARHDEAWWRGPGTPHTLERMAMLVQMIETNRELLGKPDWFFAGRATATRERLARETDGFEETLRELMRRAEASAADAAMRRQHRGAVATPDAKETATK
jgi:hypothetical protein